MSFQLAITDTQLRTRMKSKKNPHQNRLPYKFVCHNKRLERTTISLSLFAYPTSVRGNTTTLPLSTDCAIMVVVVSWRFPSLLPSCCTYPIVEESFPLVEGQLQNAVYLRERGHDSLSDTPTVHDQFPLLTFWVVLFSHVWVFFRFYRWFFVFSWISDDNPWMKFDKYNSKFVYFDCERDLAVKNLR